MMDLARAIAILRRRAEQYDAKAESSADQGGLGVYAARIAKDDADAIRAVLAALP